MGRLVLPLGLLLRLRPGRLPVHGPAADPGGGLRRLRPRPPLSRLRVAGVPRQCLVQGPGPVSRRAHPSPVRDPLGRQAGARAAAARRPGRGLPARPVPLGRQPDRHLRRLVLVAAGRPGLQVEEQRHDPFAARAGQVDGRVQDPLRGLQPCRLRRRQAADRLAPGRRHGAQDLAGPGHRRLRRVLQLLRRPRLEHHQDPVDPRFAGAVVPGQRPRPDPGGRDRPAAHGQEPRHPLGDGAGGLLRGKRRGAGLFEL